MVILLIFLAIIIDQDTTHAEVGNDRGMFLLLDSQNPDMKLKLRNTPSIPKGHNSTSLED